MIEASQLLPMLCQQVLSSPGTQEGFSSCSLQRFGHHEHPSCPGVPRHILVL